MFVEQPDAKRFQPWEAFVFGQLPHARQQRGLRQGGDAKAVQHRILQAGNPRPGVDDAPTCGGASSLPFRKLSSLFGGIT